jgi:iron complex transport system ATP-binding protein
MTLRIDALAVRYGERIAVQPTSAALAGGHLVGLIGPNGAGKSSLLKAIAGLAPAAGERSWGGAALGSIDERRRARTVAYLPQQPAAHWPLRVRDLVALGRLPHRAFGRQATAADEEAVAWAMAQTEIEPLAERSIGELSGGESARVHLARALAVQAPLLLADEPVALLDPYHQLQIMAALARYAGAPRLVIAVLHDLTLAARFCSRLLLMHEGRIVEDGEPASVLRADALRRYYRVDPYLGRHDGKPLVVPWRRHDAPTGPL